MEEKKDYWFDYNHIFDDIQANKTQTARPVPLPVNVTNVEHFKIYETPAGHKWSCWVQAWFTPTGALRIFFKNIEGGPSDLPSEYKWQYISTGPLREKGIQRNYRCLETADAGRTWRQVGMFDTSAFSVPKISPGLYSDPETLLGIGGIWDVWDDRNNTYKAVGLLQAAWSRDHGKTWSDPVLLNDPEIDQLFYDRPKMLRDGTIVLPAYGKVNNRGKAVTVPWDAGLFFSSDGGKSWSKFLLLAKGTPELSFEEPEVVELGDGSLLVVVRHTNPSKADSPEVYVNCGQIIVRKVNGEWVGSPPVMTPMGFRGHPVLLRTRDGVLICAGSGNQFNFSIDEGKTWSETQRIEDPAYKRHNHYPVLVEMPDGRVMSLYHFGNDWPYPPPEPQWIHATTFRVQKI